MAGKIKNYNEDFKRKTVELLNKKYGASKSTINQSVNFYGKSGAFTQKANRTLEENEIIELKKELKQAQMEIELLK